MKKNNRKNNNNNKIMESISYNDIGYVIKSTKHSRKRQRQRSIKDNIILDNIKSNISNIINCKNDFIIIDKINNTSVVASLYNYNITIITVINKSDPFIKEGTTLI